MDHTLVVLLFIVVVALALGRGLSPVGIAALIAAVVLVDRKQEFGGAVASGPRVSDRLAEKGFGGDLLADDPAPTSLAAQTSRESADMPPGGGQQTVRTEEYMGAIDGPPLSDDCNGAPWSGVAPDDADLQADELAIRQVRARDQHPARQISGAHARRYGLVASAVSEELAEAEDRMWWGRGDA